MTVPDPDAFTFHAKAERDYDYVAIECPECPWEHELYVDRTWADVRRAITDHLAKHALDDLLYGQAIKPPD